MTRFQALLIPNLNAQCYKQEARGIRDKSVSRHTHRVVVKSSLG